MECHVCHEPINGVMYSVANVRICGRCASTYTLSQLYVILHDTMMDCPVTRTIEKPIEVGDMAGHTETELSYYINSKSVLNSAYGMPVANTQNAAVPHIDPADIPPTVYFDARNMSEEDFVSKYCDNPDALNIWMSAHENDGYEPDDGYYEATNQ